MSDVLGGDRIDLTNEETLAKVDEETRNPTKKRRLSEADALRAAIGVDAVDAESGSSKRQSGRLAQVAAANEVNGLKAALSEAESVQSKLFKKLEQVEKRADQAEDELREYKRSSAASAGISKKSSAASQVKKQKGIIERLQQMNKEQRTKLKEQKVELTTLRKSASTRERQPDADTDASAQEGSATGWAEVPPTAVPSCGTFGTGTLP